MATKNSSFSSIRPTKWLSGSDTIGVEADAEQPAHLAASTLRKIS